MIQVVSNVIHDLLLLFQDFFARFFPSSSSAGNYVLTYGLSIGIGISVILVVFNIIRKVVGFH